MLFHAFNRHSMISKKEALNTTNPVFVVGVGLNLFHRTLKYCVTNARFVLFNTKQAYHKAYHYILSSTMYTKGLKHIWTKMGSAGFSHWQTTIYKTRKYTKKRPKQERNNWKEYSNGVTTPELASVQTKPPALRDTQESSMQTSASSHNWWSCTRTNNSSQIRKDPLH